MKGADTGDASEVAEGKELGLRRDESEAGRKKTRKNND